MGDVVFTERRKTNSLYDVLVGADEFKKTVLSVDPFVSEETSVRGASFLSDLERCAGGKFVGVMSSVVDAFTTATKGEVKGKCRNVVFFDSNETCKGEDEPKW